MSPFWRGYVVGITAVCCVVSGFSIGKYFVMDRRFAAYEERIETLEIKSEVDNIMVRDLDARLKKLETR